MSIAGSNVLPKSPPRFVPLMAVLLLLVSLELVFNRWASQLLSAESALYHAADRVGLWSFYCSGLLALGIFTWAVFLLIRDGSLSDLIGRIGLTLSAGLFVPLAGLGLIISLTPVLSVQLHMTFAVMLLTLHLAYLRHPAAPIAHRVGLTFIVALVLLQTYLMLSRHFSSLRFSASSTFSVSALAEGVQYLLLCAPLVGALTFGPRPLRKLFRPLPLVLAAMGALAFLFGLIFDYGSTARILYLGLNIALPSADGSAPQILRAGLWVISAFIGLLASLGLLWLEGADRARGAAFSLLGLAGLHLQLPGQLLLMGVGVVQLVRSSLVGSINTPSPLSSAELMRFKRFLSRLQESLGEESGHEPVTIRTDSGDVARITGLYQQLPYAVRLLLHPRGLVELEVDVGQTPKGSPPATLWRRSGSRGRSAGARNGRGKSYSMDSEFGLKDTTASVLDRLRPLLALLKRDLHGAVSIWPAEGVRYICRPHSDGWPVPFEQIMTDPEAAAVLALEDLVRTLADLARAVDVTP